MPLSRYTRRFIPTWLGNDKLPADEQIIIMCRRPTLYEVDIMRRAGLEGNISEIASLLGSVSKLVQCPEIDGEKPETMDDLLHLAGEDFANEMVEVFNRDSEPGEDTQKKSASPPGPHTTGPTSVNAKSVLSEATTATADA